MQKPIFVDLDGSTARVDAPKYGGGFVRFTLTQQAVHSPETGYLDQPAAVAEVWFSEEQAEELGKALLGAKFPSGDHDLPL